MLTKEEKSWMRKMQNLIDKCPPRLGFFTIGDPELGVFDRDKEGEFDESVDMVRELDRCDAHLGALNFSSNVHGVCG
jgi:hypothetical protein